MNRTSLIGVPLLAITLALGLAGCSNPAPTPAPGTATPASTPAQTGGALDFETVQKLTAPRFQSDPNCAAGKWSENSTGIDEEFRAAATTIQQYDCYTSAEEIGYSLPERGQQSMYVEFTDAESARAYAEDQAVLYQLFLDQTRVVVAGGGLEAVDMQAYLEELKAECNCGEILGG
jgi:hypothetical protein